MSTAALSAESRRLRIADELARGERDRAADRHAAGAPTLLCTVSAGGTGVFTSVVPHDVLGAETAGSSGSLTSAGSALVALNLGTATPAAGTPVVVTYVPYRWVYRYDG